MHSAKVINYLRTVPNELLIHAWSAECKLPSHSAKWIVAKRGSLPDSWRRRRDALSGWSGDARDWWLGDLLFFLLDFFFLPGLFFFSGFSLSVLVLFFVCLCCSLCFRFCLLVFFLLSSCFVSVSLCGSLFVSLFVLFPRVMSSLRLLPCSPSRHPLSWPFSGFIKPENAMRSCLSNGMHGGG